MLRILILGGILTTGFFTLPTPDRPKNVPAPENEEDFNKRMGIPPKTDPRMAKSSLKVPGEQGKNYFVQDGRPYINCAVSNFDRPATMQVDNGFYGNATPADAKRQEQCFAELDRRHYTLTCMAVFMYKGTEEDLKTDPDPKLNLVMQNQNCWTNQPEAIESQCYRGAKCVYNGAIVPNKQYFCCCDQHNCNEYIDFDPSKETRPEMKELARQQQALRVKYNTSLAEMVVDDEPRPRPSMDNIYIWLAVVTALIMVVSIACVTYILCRRRQQKDHIEGISETLLPVDPEQKPKKKWEVLNSSLVEIGQGKYGTVYKGEFRSSPESKAIEVAVKIFKGNHSSFTNELAIYNEPCMKKCLKPSILRLLEYDLDELSIVTEYCELGNLYSYLKNQTINSPQACLSVIQSLCEGLAFLHEERGASQAEPKPVILHRDIKSHNILLKIDSRGCLIGVIMDFGLSLRVTQTSSQEANNMMHKVVGTQRYMAPELLMGAAEIDVEHFKAIDVYAMALVFWEICSRTKVSADDEVPPYAEPLEKELREEQRDGSLPMRLSTYRQVVHHLKKRPEFREGLFKDNVFHKLRDSIDEMWDHEAGSRVRIACVKTRVDAMIRDEGYGSWDGKPPSPPASARHSSTNSIVSKISHDEDETSQSKHPSSLSLGSKQFNQENEEELDDDKTDIYHEDASTALILNGKPKNGKICHSQNGDIELQIIR